MKTGGSGSLADDLSSERVVATARRLKSVVAEVAAVPDLPAHQRQSIQDILANTIPEPAELGLE
jgi:type IV secretion system protein VirD4